MEQMKDRQDDLERAAQNLRDLAWSRDIMYDTVNTLDKVGQFTQTVLSYIPGVSILTGAALSGARAAAESIGKGDSVDNALGKGVVAGIINAAATAAFQPAKSDAALGAASKAFSFASKSSTSKGFFSSLGAALGSLGLSMKHAGVVADQMAWGAVKDVDMSVVGKATVNPAVSLAANTIAAANRNNE